MLRRILNAIVQTDEELEAFFIDHFPEEKKQLSSGMNRVQKLNILLDRVSSERIDAALRQSHPSEYEKHVDGLPQKSLQRHPATLTPDQQLHAQRLDSLHEERERAIVSQQPTADLDRQIHAIKKEQRAAQPRLQPGEYLLHYRLQEAVGAGGFGSVYRAFDRKLRLTVALKVLHPHLAAHPERRERFERGARRMAQCRHPHIVGVVSSLCSEAGFDFYVMDYLGGGTLHQKVVDSTLTRTQGLRAILDVGQALAYAHQHGLVHRDVKPQNILFDEGGQAYLTDFDLVWAADTTGGTRTGQLGTFAYIAPEATDEAGVTPLVDVYGLSMTAAFIWFGKDLPREASRSPELFWQALDCPARLKAVLQRGAAFSASARYPDVDAFCRALEAAWLAVEESLRMEEARRVEAAATESSSPLSATEQASLAKYSQWLDEQYGLWDVRDALPDLDPRLAWAAQQPLRAVYLPLKLQAVQTGQENVGNSWLSLSTAPDEARPDLFPITSNRHLLIAGSAGSGKSTWLRYQALQLAAERSGLPLLIEGKRLARFMTQQARVQVDTLLIDFLHAQLAASLDAGTKENVLRLLDVAEAPRPVLCFDGWEDLGTHAERVFRALRIFAKRYRRALLCVTAQPHAIRRFETEAFARHRLTIESVHDVKRFCERIDALVKAHAPALDASQRPFRQRLTDQETWGELDDLLVVTPLFLAQAFLLDLIHPLPENQHRVFEAYLRNLVTRVDRKQADGADLAIAAIGRETVEDRLTLVAAVAEWLETRSKDTTRSSEELALSEWIEQLTPDAGEAERHDLQEWLLGAAGVFTVQHQRIQAVNATLFPFLHAWFWRLRFPQGLDRQVKELFTEHYLHGPMEARITYYALLSSMDIQEKTLECLLLPGENAEQAADNHADGRQLRLVGSLFALGLGSADVFQKWLRSAITESLQPNRDWAFSPEWQICNQVERREQIFVAVSTAAATGVGSAWSRLFALPKYLGLARELPRPRPGCAARMLVDAVTDGATQPAHVACASIVGSGGLPGSLLGSLPLLGLWPSQRRLAAQRAQALVCLGWTRQYVIRAAREIMTAPVWSKRHMNVAEKMRGNSGNYHGIDKVVSRDIQNQPVQDWLSTKSIKAMFPFFDILNPRSTDAFHQEQWNNWAVSTYMTDLRMNSPEAAMRTASMQWVRNLLKYAELTAHQEQLSKVIASCNARVGPRAIWAHLPRGSRLRESPPSRLLAEACLLSLHPDADRRAFLAAREECAAVSDQLWRDLADYLVGEAEPAALERLRDPLVAYAASVQDPLLAAGLHYVVGGNVWFPDESELSVDELAASAGLAAPPYLMDLPPLVAIR